MRKAHDPREVRRRAEEATALEIALTDEQVSALAAFASRNATMHGTTLGEGFYVFAQPTIRARVCRFRFIQHRNAAVAVNEIAEMVERQIRATERIIAGEEAERGDGAAQQNLEEFDA